MPASSLDPLFAYDSAIEEADVSIIRASGLAAFAAFSDPDKETPFIDTQLRDAVPLGQRFIYQGVDLYNAWRGTLVRSVCTVRGKNSDQNAAMVGRLRLLSQKFREKFTPAVLPFHEVLDMKEASLDRAIDLERRLDISELRHSIVFCIRKDAWPA